MAKRRFIVSYDVSSPRRLRRVAKVLQSFGRRIQYSVFECLLDPLRLVKVKGALEREINHEQDQVLFISMRRSPGGDNLEISSLGRPYSEAPRLTII